MSSPLAFDKQGKPFSFHRRTRQLRARLFRNPSARGTCSQVLDVDGNPLYVEAESEYPLFRHLVNNVPGLYRLDQCDEDGNEIEDAPPAYITIDPPRNAQAFGSGSEEVSALAVIREMAAVQREMAAIQGQALKALAENHAQILASAAEVMRAPRPAPMAVELRNAVDGNDDSNDKEHDDEEDDYEDSDVEEEQAPTGMAGMLAQLSKMIDPKDARELGAWLMKKVMEWHREKANAASPVAAQASIDVATSPVATVNTAAAPSDVASAPVPNGAPTVVVNVAAPVAPSPRSPVPMVAPEAAMTTDEISTTASAPLTAEPATDAPDDAAEVVPQVPSLTTEQLVHVALINSQLSPEEHAIAEQVMRRMDRATQQRWLVELCAMSVDEATATVRQAIAERTQRRNKPTR